MMNYMEKIQADSEKNPDAGEERWMLRLYVAGQTLRSVSVFTNLKKVCEEYLRGRYNIEVVDLLINPARAKDDQILALPTLVRLLPVPMKKLIGGLSNVERVLFGMDIRPAS